MGTKNAGPRPLATTTYRVEIGGKAMSVELIEREDGMYVRVGDGPSHRLDVAASRGHGELTIIVGGEVVHGLVGQRVGGSTVVIDGQTVDVTVQDERAARLASATAAGRHQHRETAVRAPMPGLVVAVPVEVGQSIAKGTTLVVLSAMKMQNELTAASDGTVKEVLVGAGQTVDQNQVLVRLE